MQFKIILKAIKIENTGGSQWHIFTRVLKLGETCHILTVHSESDAELEIGHSSLVKVDCYWK